jgi:hypothetical protein
MDQSSFEKLIGSQQRSVGLFMKPADVLLLLLLLLLLLFNRSTDCIPHIYGKSFFSMIIVTP